MKKALVTKLIPDNMQLRVSVHENENQARHASVEVGLSYLGMFSVDESPSEQTFERIAESMNIQMVQGEIFSIVDLEDFTSQGGV